MPRTPRVETNLRAADHADSVGAVPHPPPSPPEASARLRVKTDIAALTDRGKVRDRNEDAFAVFRLGRFMERIVTSLGEGELPERSQDEGHLMIVADGLGGHEAGDVASHTAIVSVLEMLMRSPRWALKLDDPESREAELKDIEQRARQGLATMQSAVRQRAAAEPEKAGMGTTFTGVYSVGLDLFVMHVGDSKAFLFRRGKLFKITRDHTLAQEYADLGMIPQDEVGTHRLHHVLTRAVGTQEETPEGDFHHLRVTPGDRLLVCSDGLTDMAKESEIVEVMNRNAGSEPACRALVELALERGGRDNVTVIVAGYLAT
jgi:serine/threonine protein phosphatase PrpC